MDLKIVFLINEFKSIIKDLNNGILKKYLLFGKTKLLRGLINESHFCAILVRIILIGGILAVILAGAFWGALVGGTLGGVMGGITSVINGGSFLEGFADGALSGAVTGAITGAACAGIGLAGQAFGNTLNAISKARACATKFGKVIKVTSQVTRVISLGMDGFDLIAMGIGLFDPNHAFVQFNQKLHSSQQHIMFSKLE